MNSSQPSFVNARNVSKRYGKNKVLQDINLSIGAGEIVGLIGPNGAGKSTLLKAIMGLISYSGETLSRFPSHNAFWFGWRSAYPETHLIQ